VELIFAFLAFCGSIPIVVTLALLRWDPYANKILVSIVATVLTALPGLWACYRNMQFLAEHCGPQAINPAPCDGFEGLGPSIAGIFTILLAIYGLIASVIVIANRPK